MSRRDLEHLADIHQAIAANGSHVSRGELLDTEPGIAWTDIARMRDRLAHRYFDTEHSLVASTVRHDLTRLDEAVTRLEDRVRRSE